MNRLFACLAALSGLTALIAGTVASHVLKGRIAPDLIEAFRIGVAYQFYHTFALFVVAWSHGSKPSLLKAISGWLMIVGTILFSGSLYVLVLTSEAAVGIVAATGGVLLMVGWLMLAVGVLEIRLRPEPKNEAGAS